MEEKAKPFKRLIQAETEKSLRVSLCFVLITRFAQLNSIQRFINLDNIHLRKPNSSYVTLIQYATSLPFLPLGLPFSPQPPYPPTPL